MAMTSRLSIIDMMIKVRATAPIIADIYGDATQSKVPKLHL